MKAGEVPTMQDVAEQSGLSRFTVSKVLNGSPGVSEATRARVLRTCEKLNFVTNQHASSLAKGGPRLMGLVVTSIVDPFYGEIIQTAEQTASSLKFDLAYRCSYGDAAEERRIARAFLGLKARALVVSAVSGSENAELWATLAQSIPLVFIDHAVLDGHHLVATDHYRGAQLATQHLLERGATPHYLGSAQPLSNSAIAERQRGYVETMTTAGKPARLVPAADVAERRDNERFGFETMQQFLQAGHAQELSGLVCATDAIALGAMKALERAGIEPGCDVLITGHDDLPFSPFLKPSLTTVRQPKAWLGRQAVESAARLAELKGFRRSARLTLVQPPELVVRESTSGKKP